jgi:hypothetical protein
MCPFPGARHPHSVLQHARSHINAPGLLQQQCGVGTQHEICKGRTSGRS